jgi:UDP-N-acetylglucosamine 4,6-dehydratase/UDP-glucose 4-epimerase
MFKDKTILITGGTGSLGHALTRRLLQLDVGKIRIYSRNESKQIDMDSEFNDNRIRYFIGDVRDLERLTRAMEDVDIVFHAAALKHVPIIEYNPFEAIKTNVIGSQNIIDACLHENVERAVCIGTDKAVSPFNTYGATKLLMEKLFVTAENYINKDKHRTKFISVRYGNVLGSSGSVVQKFIKQIKNHEKITITDPSMTRFSITMDEALDFILESTALGKGSDIFVPKLRAYNIIDLKNALVELLGQTESEITGIRPGEKLHETLMSLDEMRHVWEIGNKFVILSSKRVIGKESSSYPNIMKIEPQKSYSSDLAEKIQLQDLKRIISESILLKN